MDRPVTFDTYGGQHRFTRKLEWRRASSFLIFSGLGLLRRTGVSNYVSNNDGLRERTSEDAHGRCKEVRQSKRGGTSRRALASGRRGRSLIADHQGGPHQGRHGPILTDAL